MDNQWIIIVALASILMGYLYCKDVIMPRKMFKKKQKLLLSKLNYDPVRKEKTKSNVVGKIGQAVNYEVLYEDVRFFMHHQPAKPFISRDVFMVTITNLAGEELSTADIEDDLIIAILSHFQEETLSNS